LFYYKKRCISVEKSLPYITSGLSLGCATVKIVEGASLIHKLACPPCFYYRFQESRKYNSEVQYNVINNIKSFKR
jgi:hypothetical protein